METAIVSLICIALMILGGMTMANNLLSTADTTTAGLEEMNETTGEIMRTDISILSASMSDANTLEVSLSNSGQTKIADFDRWDVIAQYYDDSSDYQVVWFDFEQNEWTVEGIYLDDEVTEEVFEPGILNPGEVMKIEAQLESIEPDSNNLVIVSTPNGVSTSSDFVGYS